MKIKSTFVKKESLGFVIVMLFAFIVGVIVWHYDNKTQFIGSSLIGLGGFMFILLSLEYKLDKKRKKLSDSISKEKDNVEPVKFMREQSSQVVLRVDKLQKEFFDFVNSYRKNYPQSKVNYEDLSQIYFYTKIAKLELELEKVNKSSTQEPHSPDDRIL